jgi:hypothetical protein
MVKTQSLPLSRGGNWCNQCGCGIYVMGFASQLGPDRAYSELKEVAWDDDAKAQATREAH